MGIHSQQRPTKKARPNRANPRKVVKHAASSDESDDQGIDANIQALLSQPSGKESDDEGLDHSIDGASSSEEAISDDQGLDSGIESEESAEVGDSDDQGLDSGVDAQQSASEGESDDQGLDAGIASEDEFSEMDESDSDLEKPTKRDAGAGFSNAVDAILGSKVKAHDRSNPILIRNKRPAQDIEDAKLDAKVRAQLRAEKLQNKDRARVKEIVPKDADAAGQALQREKRLKKTAQRGVVRLLNALHASQSAGSEATETSTSIGVDKKATQAVEASKDKFLEMIRGG